MLMTRISTPELLLQGLSTFTQPECRERCPAESAIYGALPTTYKLCASRRFHALFAFLFTFLAFEMEHFILRTCEVLQVCHVRMKAVILGGTRIWTPKGRECGAHIRQGPGKGLAKQEGREPEMPIGTWA